MVFNNNSLIYFIYLLAFAVVLSFARNYTQNNRSAFFSIMFIQFLVCQSPDAKTGCTYHSFTILKPSRKTALVKISCNLMDFSFSCSKLVQLSIREAILKLSSTVLQLLVLLPLAMKSSATYKLTKVIVRKPSSIACTQQFL